MSFKLNCFYFFCLTYLTHFTDVRGNGFTMYT